MSSSSDSLNKAQLFRTQSRRFQSPRMSRKEKYPARSSYAAQSKLLSDSAAVALLSPEVLKRAGEVEAEQKNLANELKSGKRQSFFDDPPPPSKQRKVRLGLEIPATASAPATTPEFEPVTPPQSTTTSLKYTHVSEPSTATVTHGPSHGFGHNSGHGSVDSSAHSSASTTTSSAAALRPPSFAQHRRAMSDPSANQSGTLRSPSFSQHRRGMSAPAPLDIDALRRERQYSGPFTSNPLLSQTHEPETDKSSSTMGPTEPEKSHPLRKLPPIHQMLSSPFAPGIKTATASAASESKENARRMAIKKEKFMDLCEQLWEVLTE